MFKGLGFWIAPVSTGAFLFLRFHVIFIKIFIPKHDKYYFFVKNTILYLRYVLRV